MRATSRNTRPAPNLATKGKRSRKPSWTRNSPGAGGSATSLDGHFWSWTGTHWAVIPDKILQQKILTIVNGEVSSMKPAKTLVNEVFGLLQIMQARDDDLLHFASEPPNVVNAANGELWLHDDGTVEARPHDPATGMRHVLNVSYIPKATCPEYDAAVRSIFENAEYPRT